MKCGRIYAHRDFIVKTFRIIYFSSSPELFSTTQLLQLLEKARESNHRLGITGMLLYKDGNFIQLLEGDEKKVRALFHVIAADPRHRNIVIVFEGEVDERIFADWSMGFRDLGDKALLNVPGFNDLMNTPDGLSRYRDDPSGCLYLLKMFSEN